MEKEEKQFQIIADNNIRGFIARLNEQKVRKEDIVKIIYKTQNNEYIAILYK